MKSQTICRTAIAAAVMLIFPLTASAGFSFSWSWSGGGDGRSGYSPVYATMAQCESARNSTISKIRATGATPNVGNCSGSGGGGSSSSGSGYVNLGGQIQSAVGAIGNAFKSAKPTAPAGPDPAALRRQREEEEAAERQRRTEAEERRRKAEEERKTHNELMGNLKRTGAGAKLKKISDTEPQSKSTDDIRSGSCSSVLSDTWNTLYQFGQEGQEFGYTFAKEQYTEALKATGGPITDAAAAKLGVEKYKTNYETTKKGCEAYKDLKQHEKDFDEIMVQVKACAAMKNCDWMGVLKNTTNNASSWIRTVASDNYQEALKRAEEARRFLTNYIKRMEQASEKLMTNASRCMNKKV